MASNGYPAEFRRRAPTELAVHRRAAELLKESVRPKEVRGDRGDRW